MARLRLAFLFTWGMIFGLSQIVLLIVFSAFNYEFGLVLGLEFFTAIFASIITALLLVKEEYGKETIYKEFKQDKW